MDYTSLFLVPAFATATYTLVAWIRGTAEEEKKLGLQEIDIEILSRLDPVDLDRVAVSDPAYSREPGAIAALDAAWMAVRCARLSTILTRGR